MIDLSRRWTARAGCAGLPLEFFFAGEDAIKGETERGKEICAACPVYKECRRDTMGEPYGIWAGTDIKQRQDILRLRSYNVTIMSDRRKRPLAKMVWTLRQGGVDWIEIKRQMGFNLSALHALYEWHRTNQIAVMTDVPLPGYRRYGPVTEDERTEMTQLRNAGNGINKIAELTGRAPRTVREQVFNPKRELHAQESVEGVG